MARRHKPALLKVIQGSKRLPSQPEPQPQGDLVDAPDWLSDAQKESWSYAIENAPPGLLRRIDRSVLAAWCIAETTFREASKKVEQHGMLIKSPDGVSMQSPYLSIRNKQMLLMLKCGAELGFSPSSRSGIAAERSRGNIFANNGRR